MKGKGYIKRTIYNCPFTHKTKRSMDQCPTQLSKNIGLNSSTQEMTHILIFSENMFD